MSFLSQLLEYYHLTVKDLGVRNAPGSFAHLENPFENSDFLSVVHRLENAIENHEKTVIYGDYDVDGITATTILKRVLDEKGLKPGYFIPSRYREGYGLNEERVKEFHEKGYHLIVTVDNGISCLESIKLAKSLGMDVLVIDHHDVPETLPLYDGIFHQTLSSFLSYNCSAASLVFFISAYLRNKNYDHYDATLAGLAVFSDVMPLVGNNLELAKIMLANLKTYRYPNLMRLLGEDISYHGISFCVNPLLNAPGRVSKDMMATNHVVLFLLENKETERLDRLHQELVRINDQRKKIIAEQKLLIPMLSEHSQTYQMSSCSGLSGSVANRLMLSNHLPTAVFALMEKDDNYLVGSIRVPDGYNALPFIRKNSSLFIAFGGHPKACGVTIRKQDYFRFATEFACYCALAHPDECQTKQAIPIVLSDLNEENFRIYESFEPFGEGFEKPEFVLTVEKNDLILSKNGKAVFSKTNPSGGRLCCFQSVSLIKDSIASYFEFTGSLRKNEFNGKTYYELLADKVSFGPDTD